MATLKEQLATPRSRRGASQEEAASAQRRSGRCGTSSKPHCQTRKRRPRRRLERRPRPSRRRRRPRPPRRPRPRPRLRRRRAAAERDTLQARVSELEALTGDLEAVKAEKDAVKHGRGAHEGLSPPTPRTPRCGRRSTRSKCSARSCTTSWRTSRAKSGFRALPPLRGVRKGKGLQAGGHHRGPHHAFCRP